MMVITCGISAGNPIRWCWNSNAPFARWRIVRKHFHSSVSEVRLRGRGERFALPRPL
jgi:hypothetical protein